MSELGSESSGEEIEIEVDLEGGGRIAGTHDSGIDLSPFRAWQGSFHPGKVRSVKWEEGTGVGGILRDDCETLWSTEELHGGSYLVPASWSGKVRLYAQICAVCCQKRHVLRSTCVSISRKQSHTFPERCQSQF